MTGLPPLDPGRSVNRPTADPEGWATVPEGRIQRGLALVLVSWRFLRERPRLLALPVLAAVAATAATLAFELPVLYLARHGSLSLALFFGALAAAFPLTFVSVFFNVAFLKMVRRHLDGQETSVRSGLRGAGERLPQIFGWSLLSAFVGSVLRALEQIPVVGGAAGGLVASVADFAWSLATFFVVPVLALEDLGPLQSVRRSAGVFRRRWGESVTGDIAIGAVTIIVALPGIVLVVIGFARIHHGAEATGLVLAAVGITLIAPAIAISSALTDLFLMFLYREATEGTVTGPFTAAQLQSGLRAKRRRWI